MRTGTVSTDLETESAALDRFGTAAARVEAGFEAARETLERERRELLAERRAFDRFVRRIETLEAETGPVQPISSHRPRASVDRARETTSGLAPVKKAYADTVMSLDHYAEMYDESWLESIAGELNDELATALEQHARLSPALKESLLAAVQQAMSNREQLLGLIETELEAVEDAERELAAVCESTRSLCEQPLERLEFNALRLTRARLEELRDRCDELAAERQAQLRRHNRYLTVTDIGTLERYLYDEDDRSYPVLAAIAELGNAIEHTVTVVDRSLVQVDYQPEYERETVS